MAGHVRRGGRVLGVCGGYQMLGRTVRDPDGIEGAPGRSRGLGLARRRDRADRRQGAASGDGPPGVVFRAGAFEGYEMHVGQTTGSQAPMLILDDGSVDGAVSANGQIMGCYVHGLFNQGSARRRSWPDWAWLRRPRSEPARRSRLGRNRRRAGTRLRHPSLAALAGLELQIMSCRPILPIDLNQRSRLARAYRRQGQAARRAWADRGPWRPAWPDRRPRRRPRRIARFCWCSPATTA
jgi:hypothetical protein